MKSTMSVLVAPLARRIGSLVAGAIAGGMVADPAIADRLEAWIAAGCFLAVDLVVVFIRDKSMEVR